MINEPIDSFWSLLFARVIQKFCTPVDDHSIAAYIFVHFFFLQKKKQKKEMKTVRQCCENTNPIQRFWVLVVKFCVTEFSKVSIFVNKKLKSIPPKNPSIWTHMFPNRIDQTEQTLTNSISRFYDPLKRKGATQNSQLFEFIIVELLWHPDSQPMIHPVDPKVCYLIEKLPPSLLCPVIYLQKCLFYELRSLYRIKRYHIWDSITHTVSLLFGKKSKFSELERA